MHFTFPTMNTVMCAHLKRQLNDNFSPVPLVLLRDTVYTHTKFSTIIQYYLSGS